MPKLSSLLGGGRKTPAAAAASTLPTEIYPKVLPLLGKFPAEALEKFGPSLVRALRTGFLGEEIEAGRGGGRAGGVDRKRAAEAYFECAAFIATRKELSEGIRRSVADEVSD